MKWARVLFLLLLSPFFLFSQDAALQDSRWSLIPGILNEFDMSLNSLEGNTLRSNRLIGSLQKEVSSLLISIDTQQQQLDRALKRYTALEQAALQRSQGLESSLQSLEASYKASLILNRELERENTDIMRRNARKTKAIILLAGIVALIGIVFIVRL